MYYLRHGGGPGTYNVGGGTEVSMREAIASFERLAGRELDVREHPAVPGTSVVPRPTRRGFARRSAGSRRRRSRTGCGPSGNGLLLGSRRDEPGATRLAPDPEAEREVDLRTLWARLADRWWLPVAGLVVGAVVGVLVSVGGGQTWKAKTLLYLGQPFTVQGGGQIQSLATNPRTVSEIIRSEFALKQASAASGLRVGQLRGHVTSQAVTSVGQTRNQSPLVEISVNGPCRVKVERRRTRWRSR